jgi:hypothetical protein
MSAEGVVGFDGRISLLILGLSGISEAAPAVLNGTPLLSAGARLGAAGVCGGGVLGPAETRRWAGAMIGRAAIRSAHTGGPDHDCRVVLGGQDQQSLFRVSPLLLAETAAKLSTLRWLTDRELVLLGDHASVVGSLAYNVKLMDRDPRHRAADRGHAGLIGGSAGRPDAEQAGALPTQQRPPRFPTASVRSGRSLGREKPISALSR